ncbi:unnamed protein product, partial [Staurois parvus]
AIHRVLLGDSLPAPGDVQGFTTGERPVCKQYRSLPCQLLHIALYGSAQQSQCKAHTAHIVK